MGQIPSLILPLVVFALLVGYGIWSKRYITRKVVAAGKGKEFALQQRAIKAVGWSLVLVVILGTAVFKWSTLPAQNRKLAIFGVALIAVIAAYYLIRLYYARRVR